MGEGYRALRTKVIIIVPTASVGTGIIVSPINGDGSITTPVLATAPLSFALLMTRLPGASTVSRGAEMGIFMVRIRRQIHYCC